MRKKYRCIHDIVYDLLTALLREQRLRITRLCSYANLPLDRCNEIVKYMIVYGLIVENVEENIRYYELSDRGYEYIGVYERMRELLPLKSRFVSNH